MKGRDYYPGHYLWKLFHKKAPPCRFTKYILKPALTQVGDRLSTLRVPNHEGFRAIDES